MTLQPFKKLGQEGPLCQQLHIEGRRPQFRLAASAHKLICFAELICKLTCLPRSLLPCIEAPGEKPSVMDWWLGERVHPAMAVLAALAGLGEV